MEKKAYTCGGCGTEFSPEDHVCRGCHGRIVYGALPVEVSREAGASGAGWATGTVFLMFLLPVVINILLGLQIPIGLGMGLWGLLVVFVAWAFGYRKGKLKAIADREGMCRTVFARGRP